MSLVKQEIWDELPVNIYESNQEMGCAAADEAEKAILNSIADKGSANIILAAANSQLSVLKALRGKKSIDWGKVNIFHMDEYVGLPVGHTASFPWFLRQHFLKFISAGSFHPISGNPETLREDTFGYAKLLTENPPDLCILGIGENGHIAFNDPPFADFDDIFLIKKVRLAEKSRWQQVGEEHFHSIEEVPRYAITLTIPALRSAKRMICVVPESRKADAVYKTKTEEPNEDCPATILKKTPWCTLYLDRDAAESIL